MKKWNLSANDAQYRAEAATLTWDLANPRQGIQLQTSPCPTQLEFGLFGIFPLEASIGPLGGSKHATVCGASLRTVFPRSRQFPVDVCVACCLLELGDGILGMDVVVSAGTEELDASPQLVVCSHLPDGETDFLSDGNVDGDANCLALCRPNGADISYVEMAHPHDVTESRLMHDEAPAATLRRNLFPQSLEKGVILRTRLRGLLLPRQGDEPAAKTAFARFLASPPPLGP